MGNMQVFLPRRVHEWHRSGITAARGGALPDAAFHWEFVLQHCATPANCHAHLIEKTGGVKQRIFVHI